MSLTHDQLIADVVAVYIGNHATGSFGSGRIIAPGLVLTSGHVVDYPSRTHPTTNGWKIARLKDRKADNSWASAPMMADCVWRGLGDLDLALLRLKEHPALRPELLPLFCSYDLAEPLGQTIAVGFPEAWGSSTQSIREYSTNGVLRIASQLEPYAWSVSPADKPDDPQGWRGVSGSGLCWFGADDRLHLFGAVQQVPANFTGGQLGVARVSQAFDDQGFVQHLERALGAPPKLLPFKLVEGRRPRLREVRRKFLTSFVGRNDEINELRTHLRARRALVTVTGPPGSGKTRLVNEAIQAVKMDFPHGICVVALDRIRDHSLVLAEIAAKLGIREEQERRESNAATTGGRDGSNSIGDIIEEFLTDRQVLLVLDSFEHVMPAAPKVSDLASACEHLSILVTSREVLRIQGECVVSVEGLPLPPGDVCLDPNALLDYPAVKLFEDRARGANPAFLLTAENAREVVRICERMAGLPFAIELAAARLKAFSPKALLDRLDRQPQILANGPPDLPERQRALSDAIAWSYQLLETSEQSVFRRLSIFEGEFNPGTIQSTCAMSTDEPHRDVERILESLADKSLLKRAAEPERYHMLAIIRAFARDALASTNETNVLRERHADHFLELAVSRLRPDQVQTATGPSEWLEAEIGNLRIALDWCVEELRGPMGLRLALAMRPYWLECGHVTEGRQRLAILLRVDGIPSSRDLISSPWKNQALHLAALLAAAQSDQDSARSYLGELQVIGEQLADDRIIESAMLPLAFMASRPADARRLTPVYQDLLRTQRQRGDEDALSMVLIALGVNAQSAGDIRSAKNHLNEALTIAVARQRAISVAAVVHRLVAFSLSERNLVMTRALLEKSEDSARHSGIPMLIALSLADRGRVSAEWGDWNAARAHFQEALEIGEESGNPWIASMASFHVAMLDFRSGNLNRARTRLNLLQQTQRDLGSKQGLGETILALARIAVALGKAPERLSEAIGLFQSAGNGHAECMCLLVKSEGDLKMARYEQAIRTFEEAKKAFEQLGDSIGAANTVLRIGHAYRDRQEYERAQSQYESALAAYKSIGSDSGVANCMKCEGDLLRRQKKFDDAKRKYEEALEYSRQIAEKGAEANCLLALGDLYSDMKE